MSSLFPPSDTSVGATLDFVDAVVVARVQMTEKTNDEINAALGRLLFGEHCPPLDFCGSASKVLFEEMMRRERGWSWSLGDLQGDGYVCLRKGKSAVVRPDLTKKQGLSGARLHAECALGALEWEATR